jgi:hypothetical protein
MEYLRLMQRSSTLVCLVSFLVLFSSIAEASISIVETGRTFESKPDRKVGQRLWKGYEYLARLQYVAENPTLCSLDATHVLNIVPPTDGLPVAVLVKGGGGCSTTQKAQAVSKMIKPLNMVQYLVVIDEGRRRAKPKFGVTDLQTGEEEYDDIHEVFSRETELVSFDNNFSNSKEGVSAVPNWFSSALAPADDDTSSNNGDKIMVAILHVTQTTGNELLNIVSKEASHVHSAGGTKILLNSKESMVSFRTVLMWILTTLVMCSCACCCMLLFMQSSFEEEQPEAPPRPVRRRLSLDQVRTRFPAFHYNPDEQNHQQETLNGKDAVGQDQYSHLLDECTICLDEFTTGDRCRELPCGHVFHATCIARWLIERSAVCPLCKLDLFEEVEEEATGDAEEAEPPSQTQSVLPWWGNFTTRVNSGGGAVSGRSTIEIASGSAAVATTASSTAAGNGDTLLAESRSWWPFSLEFAPVSVEEEAEGVERSSATLWRMNWFGQRRRPLSDRGMITELTEPLMGGDPDGQHQELQENYDPVMQQQVPFSAQTNLDLPLHPDSEVPSSAAEI